MSFYQPYIKDLKGNVEILPASINRDANLQFLKDFACSKGFDPDKWYEIAERANRSGFDERRAGLSDIFSHAILVKLGSEDPCVKDPLNGGVNWEIFYRGVDEEPGLFSLPREVYEARIKDGVLNAVLNENGELIGTMNAIRKLTPKLKVDLGIEDNDPRAPQVYEVGAALITKPYRGLGLYDMFRAKVLAEEGIAGRLILSQGRGKGATQVNVKNGWSLVNWRDFPFTSCLLGWACDTEGTLGGSMPSSFQLAAGARFTLPQNGLYMGHTIHFDPKNDKQRTRLDEFLNGRKETSERYGQPSHEWHKSHHLMTNDYDKLVRFEAHMLVNKGVIDYNYNSDTIWIGENGNRREFTLGDLDIHQLREIYDYLYVHKPDVLQHVYKEWQRKAYDALSNDSDRLRSGRSDMAAELGVSSDEQNLAEASPPGV